MSGEVIAALAGIGITLLGCAVSVGLVLGKVSAIDEIKQTLADLVKGNHQQDILLSRIVEHLGINPQHTKLYESK